MQTFNKIESLYTGVNQCQRIPRILRVKVQQETRVRLPINDDRPLYFCFALKLSAYIRQKVSPSISLCPTAIKWTIRLHNSWIIDGVNSLSGYGTRVACVLPFVFTFRIQNLSDNCSHHWYGNSITSLFSQLAVGTNYIKLLRKPL